MPPNCLLLDWCQCGYSDCQNEKFCPPAEMESALCVRTRRTKRRKAKGRLRNGSANSFQVYRRFQFRDRCRTWPSRSRSSKNCPAMSIRFMSCERGFRNEICDYRARSLLQLTIELGLKLREPRCPESQIRSRQDQRRPRCRRAPSCGSAASDAASFGQSQPVTDTTHGVDQFRSAILVNLLAQAI